MYVCMYETMCMCICMCAWMYVCMHVCMWVSACVCWFSMYEYVCVHACIHTCMYVCVHIAATLPACMFRIYVCCTTHHAAFYPLFFPSSLHSGGSPNCSTSSPRTHTHVIQVCAHTVWVCHRSMVVLAWPDRDAQRRLVVPTAAPPMRLMWLIPNFNTPAKLSTQYVTSHNRWARFPIYASHWAVRGFWWQFRTQLRHDGWARKTNLYIRGFY